MNAEQRHHIIEELKPSYAMELETVQNYLANSIDLDGVRAEEIKKSARGDIQKELGHAPKLAKNASKCWRGPRSRLPRARSHSAKMLSAPPEDSTMSLPVISAG